MNDVLSFYLQQYAKIFNEKQKLKSYKFKPFANCLKLFSTITTVPILYSGKNVIIL